MREDIMAVKDEIESLKKEESFAMEMLRHSNTQNEIKNKRLFIVLMTVIILWFTTIGAFVYYICNYEAIETTETYETNVDSEDNGIVNIGGDINNG